MYSEQHIPVMLKEVIMQLAPRDNGIYLDGTFGAGGYTRAILQSAQCTVYAIDRDPNVQPTVDKFKNEFGKRFNFLPGNFSDMRDLLQQHEISLLDGIVLDIGVSSMQLDNAGRGFSFMQDGPLDMRMDPNSGTSAKDLVNNASAEQLADIIYTFGDEHKSRQIARKIVEERAKGEINTTLQLAEIVRSVVKRKWHDKIDPATKTFQALRIWVNDELGELSKALEAARLMLNDEGRLVVVSFHALEDRIVKQFLQQRSPSNVRPNRHVPEISNNNNKLTEFIPLVKGAMLPSEEEISVNPRARSAKMRAARRIWS